MVLVVGATGHLGGLIVHKLLGGGKPVRALVRSEAAERSLASAGAEPVLGDLKDPASLASACAGMDAVITTANSALRGGADTAESVDLVGNRNLVDAAAAAGVPRFVFTSLLGADAASPVPFTRAKGQTEQHLRDSGMAWTILQPNAFMDVWVPAIVGGPALAGQPVLLVGRDRRHSMIAASDVASFAVAALESEQSHGRTLVLGGPEPFSWRDVLAAFERELGRKLPVQLVPPGSPLPGLPEIMSRLLAFLDTYDSPLPMGELSAAYAVRLTSLNEFVGNLVAAGPRQGP